MTVTDAPAEQANDDTEAEQVEVVTKAELVKHEPIDAHADAALEAAANAALVMPGVAGRDEFLALAMQARVLSLSGAAPKIIRENPHVALHVAMIGRDLGISPSASIELIDVMDTASGPKIALSPQLLNGQIRRLALGSILPVMRSEVFCAAAAIAPGGEYDMRCRAKYPDHVDDCRCRGVLGVTEFTWEDARDGQLVGRDCQYRNHSEGCKSGGSVVRGVRCAQGYKTYPKRMMWWRAAGFCADDYFPEAGLGLYTAEELGATVDHEGRPIDVMSVELPPGYEVAEIAAAAKKDQGAACDTADAAWMQAVIRGVDAETRKQLSAPWTNSVGPIRPEDVPAGRAGGAKALLRGMVKDVEAAVENGSRVIVTMIAVAGVLGLAVVVDLTPPQTPPDRPGGDAADPVDGDATDGAGEPPAASEAVIDATAVETPATSGRHANEDPMAAVAADMVRTSIADAAAAGVERADVESIANAVKILHHAKVNAELEGYGETVDDLHIDTRRMMLTSRRVDRLVASQAHDRGEHATSMVDCPVCEAAEEPAP